MGNIPLTPSWFLCLCSEQQRNPFEYILQSSSYVHDLSTKHRSITPFLNTLSYFPICFFVRTLLMSESKVYRTPAMDEKGDEKDAPQVDLTDSDPENSVEIKPTEEPSAATIHNFPEGGARAWSVAVGAAGVIFCTFGYANAFGYAFLFDIFHSGCCSDHK
jgi:hypothetical protein